MSRNLSQGMSGTDVKAIQQALNIWLPNRKPLADDGPFGPVTRAAIVEFQNQHGLAPDGVVGPKTLTALYPLAPYHGHTTIVSGGTPSVSKQTVTTTPAAATSVVMERIPGIPVAVPIPQAKTAAPAANLPAAPAGSPTVPPSGGNTPASPSGVTFQKMVYQLGTTTSWPINFSKPGVTGLQMTVKGVFLLGGSGLSLAVGGSGTLAIDDGAKNVASGVFQIAWAPSFLKLGDLASLSAIAQLSVGVLGVKGSSAGPAFFDQQAINIKLGLGHGGRFFGQTGITFSQDQNSGNLGLHAPKPGFGVAAGVSF
jgi:hypothetical protein